MVSQVKGYKTLFQMPVSSPSGKLRRNSKTNPYDYEHDELIFPPHEVGSSEECTYSRVCGRIVKIGVLKLYRYIFRIYR